MRKKIFRAIATYVLVFILGGMASTFLFPSLRYISLLKRIPPIDKDTAYEEAIMSNEEQVRRFSDGSWTELSDEEKVAAMHTIVDIEVIYLGLPHEVPIIVKDLPHDTYAQYSSKERTIHINEILMDEETSPYMVLSVICHEIYHAYQFAQVYLYDSTNEMFQGLRIFDEAREYKYELTGFFKNSEGASWWEYKSQTMEMNADKYGYSSANFYMEYFDE